MQRLGANGLRGPVLEQFRDFHGSILYRQKNIGYDKTLYIVDNRQSLHFKQLFDSIKFFNLSIDLFISLF